MTDVRTFTLKVKRDSVEDKWLRQQANGTASLTSLIQMAIEQFGYEDIDKLLKTASIKNGLVKLSNAEAENITDKNSDDKENEIVNKIEKHKTVEDSKLKEEKKKDKNSAKVEKSPSSDEILNDPGLSQ
ncbi:hypothetical protein [Lactobacillus hominis]|uniref:hypothetical protein n=1 Tax=Lactobacillus hominis TaxID=1203033 RepID=UPI002634C230|nr:hypothetical protein [Lactobacillus hominis]